MLKNKKWICNFIALFILISGMWVDEIKADSIFLCPKFCIAEEISVQESNSIENEVPNTVFTDTNVESTEILCIRNTISSQQITAQIIKHKRIIKLSMLFLCVAVFALLLSNFYTAKRLTELPILCTQTAVLNYIHNMDGKK